MTTKEYDYITDSDLDCYKCHSTEDIVIDEDGDAICTICLSDPECEKLND